MKQFFSLAMSVMALLFAGCDPNAPATSSKVETVKFQYGNLYYETLSSNTAEVVDCYISDSTSTSVSIPTLIQYNGKQYTVTSIGESAFWNCSSLTSVTIPNSVTNIGRWAFNGCSSLTSVTIPNGVTSIWDGAFEYCSSLTSITIPNSVTSIGYLAFIHCSSLTSITIPNSVTSIGGWAFYHCSSLRIVICKAILVPSIGYNVFAEVPISSAVLYVPDESVDIYKYMDPCWNDFGTILPISQLPTDVEDIQISSDKDASVKKVIRNGQVVILHNDKSYNIMGQEVE